MAHGDRYKDSRGNEFMDDHINGVDWHIPKGGDAIGENGEWLDDEDN